MASNSGSPPKKLQPKLEIGKVGDRYEQEADRTASEVVRAINQPIQKKLQRKSETQFIQSQGNTAHQTQKQFIKPFKIKSQDEIVQQKQDIASQPRNSFIKPLRSRSQDQSVQRQEAIAGGTASADLESSIQSARGSGKSLDANLQQSMGQAMGADFSSVKVHTDSQSDQLNKSIQAKAFTTGQDVFFRQGAYDPSSQGGQELIAHELTHVVQQNGNTVQTKLESPTIQRVSVKEQVKLFEIESLKAQQQMKKTTLPEKLRTEVDTNRAKTTNENDTKKSPVVEPEESVQEGVNVAERVKLFESLNKGSTKSTLTSAEKLKAKVAANENDTKKSPVVEPEVATNTAEPTSENDTDSVYLEKIKTGGFKWLSTNYQNKEKEAENDKDKKFAQRLDTLRAQGKGYEDLSEAEIAAIRVYTARDYKYINPALEDSLSWFLSSMNPEDKMVKGKMDDGKLKSVGWDEQRVKKIAEGSKTEEGKKSLFEEFKGEAKEHVGMAIKGMKKVKPFVGELYRGEHKNITSYNNDYKEGNVIHKAPFFSASRKQSIQEQYAYTGLRPTQRPIYVTINSKTARDIDQLSVFYESEDKSEGEVTFLPSSDFKVTKVETFPDSAVNESDLKPEKGKTPPPVHVTLDDITEEKD
jgi:hypothetical protein